MVVVRCRPLSNKEKEISDNDIVKILDRKVVILKDPTIYNGPNDIFKNRSREQNYAFDFAFDKTSNTVLQLI
jgi:kinesin family protein 18/19